MATDRQTARLGFAVGHPQEGSGRAADLELHRHQSEGIVVSGSNPTYLTAQLRESAPYLEDAGLAQTATLLLAAAEEIERLNRQLGTRRDGQILAPRGLHTWHRGKREQGDFSIARKAGTVRAGSTEKSVRAPLRRSIEASCAHRNVESIDPEFVVDCLSKHLQPA